MVLTNQGRTKIITRTGSAITVPSAIAIGNTSGLIDANRLALYGETDKNSLTSTAFIGTTQSRFTADFSASEVSGTLLREFGLFSETAASTGSAWVVENFPALTLDGSNELSIEVNFIIF